MRPSRSLQRAADQAESGRLFGCALESAFDPKLPLAWRLLRHLQDEITDPSDRLVSRFASSRWARKSSIIFATSSSGPIRT